MTSTTDKLTPLIDEIERRADQGEGVSVRTIQEVAGKRVAGPLLFFPAMVVVSPLSLIPTLPTIIAVTVLLIAGQLVIGRRTIWLPRRLREASMSPERTHKVIGFLRPAMRWIDTLSKPRLTFLTRGLGMRLAAILCMLVALTMPPMELVPGASTTAGVVIATFGLSLTTQDGFLMLLALSLIGAATWLVLSFFF